MARRIATRPDAIRLNNLRVVLAEIHHHGAQSRSQLTRGLGLNRSTIGALVADLSELGLVFEHAPENHGGAGRPSHVVAPEPSGPYAIAIDFDVQRVVTAAVALGGAVLSRHSIDIEPFAEPCVAVEAVGAAWAETARGLPVTAWPVGVGVSIAGTVRRADQRVLVAPNLRWRDIDLAHPLAEVLGGDLSVRLGNDANLGAMAEHIRGCGRGIDNVLYLFARAGVGAGIISDGVLLGGVDGVAGEVGHLVMDPNGEPCDCGRRGCLETFIGERALLRAAGLEDREVGSAPTDLVLEMAGAGNPSALRAIDQIVEWLCAGLAEMAMMLNPQLIVLGGSIAVLARQRRDQVQRLLDARLGPPGETVTVEAGQLGSDAALIGAAELGFADLLDQPAVTASALRLTLGTRAG